MNMATDLGKLHQHGKSAARAKMIDDAKDNLASKQAEMFNRATKEIDKTDPKILAESLNGLEENIGEYDTPQVGHEVDTPLIEEGYTK